MNIAIIGGSGFVGTRLIELLRRNENLNIRNYDKQQSSFYPELTTIGNVLDISLLTDFMKNQDVVILLAAEHRDDVSPKSLYYEVNVNGMKNVLEAMDKQKVKRIVFTSSVAVYGLNKVNPNEEHPISPFNDYGKSKWSAEILLQNWIKDRKDDELSVSILRPTVIFGERNRGNVFNLLKQIAIGKFMMIGKGENKKSMAYIGNIVSFIKFLIENGENGIQVYNYADKPDFSMNELVTLVGKVMNKDIPTIHIPYGAGLIAGYGFDILAKIKGKKLNISSVRVKKFCATTQFSAEKVTKSGYVSPYSLMEGLTNTLQYEFIDKKDENQVTFVTE